MTQDITLHELLGQKEYRGDNHPTVRSSLVRCGNHSVEENVRNSSFVRFSSHKTHNIYADFKEGKRLLKHARSVSQKLSDSGLRIIETCGRETLYVNYLCSFLLHLRLTIFYTSLKRHALFITRTNLV